MAITIESGATTDNLSVDSNKAMRVTLYDTSGNSLVTAKGTQANRGIGVQQFKDSGRTSVIFYSASFNGATSETLVTLTQSVSTLATVTGTSFVIPAGKRFRIQAIHFGARGHATPTVHVTTVKLRITEFGGNIATTTTPITLLVRVGCPGAAIAVDYNNIEIPFPDGYEILGDGVKQIGLSYISSYTTNAPTLSVLLIGYYY